ncbi:hypothetical protein ACF1BR_18800 [Streptomyces rubiginosohelvolus]|uniref:hypothetical protein n=1 Tax=Streptomyces rubiginosohelvolus TaxID=67362 RepID=UPI0037023800
MGAEDAAPCRHAGAPPADVVERVSRLIRGLGGEESLLTRHGITPEEFHEALGPSIEKMRGSSSAGVSDRRRFMQGILGHLASSGLITRVAEPHYGDDTVYRLSVPGMTDDVAIIQKGCPDGAHSSIRWSVPDWAGEAYLWWVCGSMNYHPGVHVHKGVQRLFQRFIDDRPDQLAGVIFHNELCGGSRRLCPKSEHAVVIDGRETPPPCVYVMPDREPSANEWNWNGGQKRAFPTVLMKAFGITEEQAPLFVGHVGYRVIGEKRKTNVVSRYGIARMTSHRS